jgi:hypothetical protein
MVCFVENVFWNLIDFKIFSRQLQRVIDLKTELLLLRQPIQGQGLCIESMDIPQRAFYDRV